MPVGVAAVDGAVVVVHCFGVEELMSTVSRTPAALPELNCSAVTTAMPIPVDVVLVQDARLGSMATAMGCWSIPMVVTVGVAELEVIDVRSMAEMLLEPVLATMAKPEYGLMATPVG